MSQRHNKSESSYFDIIGLIVYIAIYSLMIFYQQKFEQYGEVGNILQGISSQLLLLLSTFVVVAIPKSGYYVSVILNVLASLRLVIVIISQDYTLTVISLISTLATIILISIIHVFYQKVIKNNNDLIKANMILKEKDEKLTYLAYYDILTGLPNRQLFIERIDEAINLIDPVPFTVVAANIDNFKIINNEFGNNAGDAVLCSYSKKLRKFCGNSMFLARINGDEFGIIVYGKESEATILNYIEAIREIVAEPIKFMNTKIYVTMSFGAASYPLNASDSTEILKCVNSALSYSKFNGKNRHCFYNNITNSSNK